MEAMGNLVIRALVAVAIVALGIAVYALVVNLGMQSELGELRAEIAELETDLASARGQLEVVRGDVGAISSGVVEQGTRLDEILGRVNALETLTSPLDQVLSFLRSTFPDLDY
jgi:hypothetical protein